MSMPGAFLGGAKNRLLPASLPFRFFVSAAIFHILAWLALFIGAADLAGFVGGPGVILASLHLLTLGVFAMTAIGASYQLLPIATRQPLARTWPARMSFWFIMPGIPVLAFGMIDGGAIALTVGGVLVSLGLLVFTVLTADNLRRASSMPVVAAHGWAALLALLGVGVIGLALILDFESGFLGDHQGMALLHMGLAVFGFMGLLVLGFSQVLIPMFVLSRALPQRYGWTHLGLAILGLAAFGYGLTAGDQRVVAVGGFIGILAGGFYVWLMRNALKSSMRKRLGDSFILIKASWGFLLLGLLIGFGVAVGLAIPNGAALFGYVVLVGWMLSFLMGILQRIIPFLASMHVEGKSGRPPLLSELTPALPLKIHLICHFSAFALCSIGIILDLNIAVQIGALVGLAGAVAFACFVAIVIRKLALAAD
jgi:hypothetical protein